MENNNITLDELRSEEELDARIKELGHSELVRSKTALIKSMERSARFQKEMEAFQKEMEACEDTPAPFFTSRGILIFMMIGAYVAYLFFVFMVVTFH